MKFTNVLNHTTKQPKTILKIVVSVSVGLLVLWIFLVSKMDLPSQRDTVLVFEDSTSQVIDVKNSLLGEDAPVEKNEIANNEQPAVFQGAFTTFFVMVTILGGVWLWASRKKKTSHLADQDVKEISQHVIGQGAQLRIVEINDEVWVLGVSPNGINLLHRYPKNEWKPPTKIPPGEDISGSDFNSILKMLGN